MSIEPADWDPANDTQKTLLRDARTGELGWIVRRSGARMVRLDRPGQEILRRYIESEWLNEETHRPLAPIHAARVAFEADRAVCREVGLRAHARREWGTLSDGERQLFRTKGPKTPPVRAALYAAVMEAMKPFVREG